MISASHVGTWVGNVWGTYAGNAVLEIVENDAKIEVEISVNINGQVIVLKGPLTLSGGKSVAAMNGDAVNGSIEAVFIFDVIETNRIEGKWRQPDQNNGVFQFQRRASQAVAAPQESNPSPIQVIQRTG